MATLGPTSDFSPIASRYDATREVPQQCLQACYERLLRESLLPAQGVILDAGCGTGEISLPLARMGYDVHGIDVSSAMISIARTKCQPGWRARYVVADVRAIPEIDHSIDAVVVSKLFQHVHDWQTACRELVRVLKPGACIFQLNERGAFGNLVRMFFARRADGLGHTERFIGVRDKSHLTECLTGLGCRPVSFDTTDLKWQKKITYGDAFDQLQERLFAEFWYLPADVYQQLLAETARWVEAQPAGRETVEHMTPYLVTDVFRKSHDLATPPKGSAHS